MKDERDAWYGNYDDNMPLNNLQLSKRNKQYISNDVLVFIVFLPHLASTQLLARGHA